MSASTLYSSLPSSRTLPPPWFISPSGLRRTSDLPSYSILATSVKLVKLVRLSSRKLGNDCDSWMNLAFLDAAAPSGAWHFRQFFETTWVHTFCS